MDAVGFYLYLISMASYFLHFTERVPFFGTIRLDLLLILAIIIIKIINSRDIYTLGINRCHKMLNVFIATVLIITPFVEYPGSVIYQGLPNFLKVVVFFYFTVWFITSKKRIIVFITVFVLCQTFRFLEPTYLHLTQGYWGDKAFIQTSVGPEFMNRLSGAPLDYLNPNGLAFVIISTMPFIPFLARLSKYWKLYFLIVTPISLYSLMLTGSRSGIIVFVIVAIYIVAKEKHKIILSTVSLGVFALIASQLSNVLMDRYRSVFDSNTMNHATASGRIFGLIQDYKLGLIRPIFGFGLGTSLEANYNYANIYLRSHNLYLEVFIELGIVGFIVYLLYLREIYRNIFYKRKAISVDFDNHMEQFQMSLASFFILTVLFCFASYNLSLYPFYMIGGLSISSLIANKNLPVIQ